MRMVLNLQPQLLEFGTLSPHAVRSPPEMRHFLFFRENYRLESVLAKMLLNNTRNLLGTYIGIAGLQNRYIRP